MFDNRYQAYTNKKDKEEFDKLNQIIGDDVWLLSPERDDNYDKPYHNAISGSKSYDNNNLITNNSGIITNYKTDGDYIRVYALLPYTNGIVIIIDKKYKMQTIVPLIEDDGFWQIDRNNSFTWFDNKNDFVTLIAEALSIYNENYEDDN